jgi:hypothetical protein
VPYHIHNSAYVTNYIDKDIFLIPIRNPLDCITSWHWSRHNDSKEGDLGKFSFESDFNFYINFYSSIVEVKDKVVVLDFNKFTTDNNYIYSLVQQRTGIEATSRLSSDEVRQIMVLAGDSRNLPRDNKSELDLIKPQVLNHPLYDKVCEVYNLF